MRIRGWFGRWIVGTSARRKEKKVRMEREREGEEVEGTL